MKLKLYLIIFLPFTVFAQHSIKGVFSPAGDFELALLYKVTPTHSNYVTNTPIAADGSFEIKLDSTVTKGIYRITYAVPQEEYNFDVIYNGKEDIELNFNTETGVEFLSSKENKLLASYTRSMLMITEALNEYYNDTSATKDTLALATIFKTQKETQQGFEDAAKGTIALNFIKANTTYIPEQIDDAKSYVESLKATYFDHIDFNNKILQSSKFLTERMLNYVFGIRSQEGSELEDYKNNIKKFYASAKSAPATVQKSLFTDLWEQMVDLKLDTIANFIAENYLMDLAVNLNDAELLQALILYQNTSIGNKAPDFDIEVKKDDALVKTKLSQLNTSDYYIIAFWSSTCSHCLSEIPQLHDLSKTLKTERLQVIAFGLEDNPDSWKSLTYDFPNFIHVYGDGKWDNEIGNTYGVNSTPTYFILDSDKNIVAKPEYLDELQSFFETKTSNEEK